MSKPLQALVIAIAAVSTSTAAAEELVYDLAEAVSEDLIYASGDAFLHSDENGVFVELTPAESESAGSIFSRASVDSASFETQFAFRIEDRGGGGESGCNDAPGADGFAMVILPAPDGLGADGGSMGYEGIGTLVSIEFDTFCNPHVNDLDSNHAAILIGGETQHSADHRFSAGVSPDFDLGDQWYAWVDYDGTYLSLQLDLSPTAPGEPILVREMDIPAIVAGDRAHIGFTAGTGAAWGRHLITEWIHFGDTEQEREPEPDQGSIDGASSSSPTVRSNHGRGSSADRRDDLSSRGLRPLGERGEPDFHGQEAGSARAGSDRGGAAPVGTNTSTRSGRASGNETGRDRGNGWSDERAGNSGSDRSGRSETEREGRAADSSRSAREAASNRSDRRAEEDENESPSNAEQGSKLTTPLAGTLLFLGAAWGWNRRRRR